MTVITYKNGTMACDALWTDNEFKAIYRSKITHLSNGLFYGGSGGNDDRAIRKLISSIVVPLPHGRLTTEDFPTVCEIQDTGTRNCQGMVINPNTNPAQIFIVSQDNDNGEGEGTGVWEVTLTFYAIGSGKDLAMGAMAFGANAEEGVRIACKYTPSCEEPLYKVKIWSDDDET